jgi:hypothetical protein
MTRHATNYDDYKESPTMREIHQIQEEMEQQFQKSGMSSYWEWLQATDKNLRQSLAEDGFRMITRNGRIFLHEIKPQSKKKNTKYKTASKRNKAAARKKSAS